MRARHDPSVGMAKGEGVLMEVARVRATGVTCAKVLALAVKPKPCSSSKRCLMRKMAVSPLPRSTSAEKADCTTGGAPCHSSVKIAPGFHVFTCTCIRKPVAHATLVRTVAPSVHCERGTWLLASAVGAPELAVPPQKPHALQKQKPQSKAFSASLHHASHISVVASPLLAEAQEVAVATNTWTNATSMRRPAIVARRRARGGHPRCDAVA